MTAAAPKSGPPAAAYAKRLSETGFAVFLFHGVIARHKHRVRNYIRKHIEAARFDEVLSALCAAGAPVSMDDVLAALEGGPPLPPRAFAVTFDDGFENNASEALPVLEAHGVPAALYATTGFIGENRMSWIDRIEWAMEDTAAETITPPWAAEPVPVRTDAEKTAALDGIRAHVKSSPGADPGALAGVLQAQLGFEETWSSDDPLDRKLTWDELRAFAAHPLITVGGHSHSHAILSFLEPSELARELDLSLDLLREKAGIRTRHYSYPEGLAHTFNKSVAEALKARGVRLCPAAEDGVNPPDADPFGLLRIAVV